jgi:hypothetical protein
MCKCKFATSTYEEEKKIGMLNLLVILVCTFPFRSCAPVQQKSGTSSPK